MNNYKVESYVQCALLKKNVIYNLLGIGQGGKFNTMKTVDTRDDTKEYIRALSERYNLLEIFKSYGIPFDKFVRLEEWEVELLFKSAEKVMDIKKRALQIKDPNENLNHY